MLRDSEIAKILEVSKETAYKRIKELNKELSKQGFVIIVGRLPRWFWEDKFYGGVKSLYYVLSESLICRFARR